MKLSYSIQAMKRRETMIKKLGSLEAYQQFMHDNAILGGKKKVPKGYAITKRKK